MRALQEGWIAGAGVDVLSVEPPREGNPPARSAPAESDRDPAHRLGIVRWHAVFRRPAHRQHRRLVARDAGQSSSPDACVPVKNDSQWAAAMRQPLQPHRPGSGRGWVACSINAGARGRGGTGGGSSRPRLDLQRFDDFYDEFLRLTWAAKGAFETRDHRRRSPTRGGASGSITPPSTQPLISWQSAFPQLKEHEPLRLAGRAAPVPHERRWAPTKRTSRWPTCIQRSGVCITAKVEAGSIRLRPSDGQRPAPTWRPFERCRAPGRWDCWSSSVRRAWRISQSLPRRSGARCRAHRAALERCARASARWRGFARHCICSAAFSAIA